MRLNQVLLATGICLSIVVSGGAWAKEKDKGRKPSSFPERPPQYVLLAFDGSLNLDFWRESTAFAESIDTRGNQDEAKKLRFTYFINPVYYIEAANKSVYQTPGLNRPVSCIGWSDPTGSFVERVAATNRAFEAGHEIASHANSHCDASGADPGNPMYGKRWGEAEWTSEFDQFNKILFNIFSVNKSQAGKIAFQQQDIVGFRAPLLAVTDGLWPTLKRFNYRYDTSKIDMPTYWPQKMGWQGWNIPLAQIKVAGSNRKTLSMDFNWYVFQSAGQPVPNMTPETRARLKKQVIDSYKYYFKINYFGGRAPVQLGHHFSKWNQGIYWEAMQEFAQFVCSRKEVRCVTFREYTDWLDSLPPEIYQNYRSGKFEKLADDKTIQDIAVPVLADIRMDMGNEAFEVMVSETDKPKMKVMKWQTALQVNFEKQPSTRITKEELIRKVGAGKTAFLRASLLGPTGAEINWQTYKIENLGTPKEIISSEPIENQAVKGETIEAHKDDGH